MCSIAFSGDGGNDGDGNDIDGSCQCNDFLYFIARKLMKGYFFPFNLPRIPGNENKLSCADINWLVKNFRIHHDNGVRYV